MSDKFCFSVELDESNKIANFYSDTGDKYRVTYTTKQFCEIMLSIEWFLARRNMVKVELFTADSNLISSQMRLGTENRVSFNFCVTTKEEGADEFKLMFVITVIPYIDMEDCPVSSKNEVEALNDSHDKLKELSEDLLVGLAMDMRDLFIHGALSDVVVTNGSHVVKAHAAVLSARSAAFRRICCEKSEKIITISEASATALQDMVMFIYSSFIKIKSMDSAEELYILANKYEIEDLQDLCSMYLSNCTVERALRTLVLAEKYRDNYLKKSSIDFILKNLGEVKSSGKWESFEEDNSELVSEIYSHISSIKEKEALKGFMSRMSAKKLKI